ncbi:MAG TPA: NfeD family protein, partial [Aeromonadales bacterium]|nr:NfeD family protein [Aeromonadales bacterium]
MIAEALVDLQYWHWGVAGLVLLVLEIFAPGAIFLWFGIAALVVSLLKALIPSLGWELQFIIFSILSVVSIISWRLFFKKNPPREDPDSQTLNRRGSE